MIGCLSALSLSSEQCFSYQTGRDGQSNDAANSYIPTSMSNLSTLLYSVKLNMMFRNNTLRVTRSSHVIC
jgi:hypothetical protein